jgi:hypothetical protein
MTKHILHELTGFVYEYLQDIFKLPECSLNFSSQVTLFTETNDLTRFQIGGQSGHDERARVVEDFDGDGGDASACTQDARVCG